jgi:hypothetical protein
MDSITAKMKDWLLAASLAVLTLCFVTLAIAKAQVNRAKLIIERQWSEIQELKGQKP